MIFICGFVNDIAKFFLNNLNSMTAFLLQITLRNKTKLPQTREISGQMLNAYTEFPDNASMNVFSSYFSGVAYSSCSLKPPKNSTVYSTVCPG